MSPPGPPGDEGISRTRRPQIKRLRTVADDRGHRHVHDEAGNFTIVDRLKELKVKDAGCPALNWKTFRGHSGPGRSGHRVPDEKAGELPRAYVIRKNRNVSEQSVIDSGRKRAAPTKVRRRRNFESLPRTRLARSCDVLRRKCSRILWILRSYKYTSHKFHDILMV